MGTVGGEDSAFEKGNIEEETRKAQKYILTRRHPSVRMVFGRMSPRLELFWHLYMKSSFQKGKNAERDETQKAKAPAKKN